MLGCLGDRRRARPGGASRRGQCRKTTPQTDVRRISGEERVAFAGPVAAPLVETERVVHEPGDAARISRGHALSQPAGAHVGAVAEVERGRIVHQGSSRKVKEKVKKSSNVYI